MIVIDKSGSMGWGGNAQDGVLLMDIAKDAALTVLATLNPKDRVSFIAMLSNQNVKF